MKKRGFSLIEMLVVLIIMSIIVTALTPVITKKLSTSAVIVKGGGSGSSDEEECEAGGLQYTYTGSYSEGVNADGKQKIILTTGGTFTALNNKKVTLFLVGGGGGGGLCNGDHEGFHHYGGAGGGGGYTLETAYTFNANSNISVVIGAGGAAGKEGVSSPTDGGQTSFGTFTALGGKVGGNGVGYVSATGGAGTGYGGNTGAAGNNGIQFDGIWYGGGGAGYGNSTGGQGGGANGAGIAGTAGLGGGGGGGAYYAYSGAGGSGTVIILASTEGGSCSSNSGGSGSSSSGGLSKDCSSIDTDCKLCNEDTCIDCDKNCTINQYQIPSTCKCEACSTKIANCETCDKTGKVCLKCTDGYGLSGDACTQCVAGKYSDGTTKCKNASIGYYVANAGASTQTACGQGTYQSASGKTSCIDCPAGTYQNEAGAANCEKCNAGTYAETTKNTHKAKCLICEIGTVSGSAGATACTQCPEGKGSYARGTRCYNCPANCKSCFQPNKCEVCKANYYLYEGTCNKCTEGQYCPGNMGNTSCSAQIANCTSCTSDGICTACKSGYRLDNNACTACGSNCLTCDASTCTKCKDGTVINTYNASTKLQCITCTSNCEACTLDPNGVHSCTKCKAGYELYSTTEDGNTVKKCKETFKCANNVCQKGLLYYTQRNVYDKYQHTAGAYTYDLSDIALTTVTPGQSCDATTTRCCWKVGSDNVTTAGDNCNTGTSYSGCNRTVCNYQAAVRLCQKLTVAGYGTGWRLPTQKELQAITVPDHVTGNITWDNGLKLCDKSASKTDTAIYSCPNSSKCLGAAQDLCMPAHVWSGDISNEMTPYSIYVSNKTRTQSNAYPTNYAMSVRCVKEVE